MCLFSGRGRGDSAVTGSWIRAWSSHPHEEENLLLVQTIIRTPWGHFLPLSCPFHPSFFCYFFLLVKHHQIDKILRLLSIPILQTSWTVWKKTKKRLNTITEQKSIKCQDFMFVFICSCIYWHCIRSLFFQFNLAFLLRVISCFTIYVKYICHHNSVEYLKPTFILLRWHLMSHSFIYLLSLLTFSFGVHSCLHRWQYDEELVVVSLAVTSCLSLCRSVGHDSRCRWWWALHGQRLQWGQAGEHFGRVL